MDDTVERYAAMIEGIAQIYVDNPIVHAQLRSLRVTEEEWDESRRGGHFGFEVSGPPAADSNFTVDARAEDEDGAIIDIIIHPVDGLLNWGEWFRYPRGVDDFETPIQRWPPSSVRPNKVL